MTNIPGARIDPTRVRAPDLAALIATDIEWLTETIIAHAISIITTVSAVCIAAYIRPKCIFIETILIFE